MLNDNQKLVIKCAYADLLGALQNYEQGSYAYHDWDAHKQTLEELISLFPFVEE
jgi:hypothetical protein